MAIDKDRKLSELISLKGVKNLGKIKIVPAKAHESQMNDPEIKREINDVQEFFNTRSFPFKKGTINYVLLRGTYSHIERAMTIVGVFVNTTGKTICGLKTNIEFRANEKREAQFGEILLELPQSFLGEIKENEGFVLHIKVPVQGLDASKQIYEAPELSGALKNVEIAFPA